MSLIYEYYMQVFFCLLLLSYRIFTMCFSHSVFHSLFATAPKHTGWHWRSDLVSYENRMHPVFSIRRGKNATATKKTTNQLDSHTSNILKVPHGKRTMNTRIRVSSNGNWKYTLLIDCYLHYTWFLSIDFFFVVCTELFLIHSIKLFCVRNRQSAYS